MDTVVKDKKTSNKKTKWLIAISIVGCVVFLHLGYILIQPFYFARSFETISVGMTKDEVVQKLGRPNDQSEIFHLGQYEGYEKEYERAKGSNSKYYLFWWKGIDITFTVGFDEEDKVVLKASGGT